MILFSQVEPGHPRGIVVRALAFQPGRFNTYLGKLKIITIRKILIIKYYPYRLVI